jgi:small-conductance mechanosensitive channel
VQRSTDLSPSIKVAIGKFIKISLIMLAGAIALSAAGGDLTALTVYSGAVGVGIGSGFKR